MIINGKSIQDILRENEELMKSKKEHMKLFGYRTSLNNNINNNNDKKKELRHYFNTLEEKTSKNKLNINDNNFENKNPFEKNLKENKKIKFNNQEKNQFLSPNYFIRAYKESKKKKNNSKKLTSKNKNMSTPNIKTKKKIINNINKPKSKNLSKNLSKENFKNMKNKNSKRKISLGFHNQRNYNRETYNLNIPKPKTFFQRRIMTSRKIDGKTDNVSLYHMHNKEWSQNHILKEMKQNEKLSYGYINYCPYI